MDALAGYGSEDDDSSADAGGEQKKALVGLMDYSDHEDDDDSSSDNNGEVEKVSPAKESTGEAKECHLNDNSATSSNNDNARKRKRSWDNSSNNNDNKNTNETILLPPPPLSNDKSLIEWDTDYIEKYRQAPTTTSTDEQLTTKLAALQQNSSSQSWAQHLKSQHEFHNPHFFDNVVSHFGIEEPLSSNIDSPPFELYEYNLVAAEEQARIRQEQERQEVTEQSRLREEQHQLMLQQTMAPPSRSRGMSM